MTVKLKLVTCAKVYSLTYWKLFVLYSVCHE